MAQMFTPVEHDPFAPFGAEYFPGMEAANAPKDPMMAGRDPQGLLSRAGGAAMDYMRWNLMGSPGFTPGEIGTGMAKSVADAGRMMTTPPPQLPQDVHDSDSGLVVKRDGQWLPWQQVDPAGAASYYEEMQKRQDLPMDVALAMVGGGAPAAERGALGVAGGKLTQPMLDIYQGRSAYNKGTAFYSPDKEFARQFTQSGLDPEIATARISPQHVYEPPKEVYAGDMDSVDAAIAEARKGGYKAIKLSEGQGQPSSYFVFDRSAFHAPGFRRPSVFGSGATDERLGAVNLAAQAEHAAAQQQPGIRAYHGSPHDFDQFDISKIGTGEGAQAYGHGLYFAEAEPVAREYRSKLAGKPDVMVGGQAIAPRASIFDPAEADQIVASRLSSLADLHAALNKEQITTAEAVKRVSQDIDNSIAAASRNNDFGLFQKLQDQKTALARMQDRGIDLAHKGRMYEVNIAAHPDQFLDWDKPLSEQSEHVRSVYQKLTGAVDPAESAAKVRALNDQMEALGADRDPVTNQMKEERKWMQLARERDVAWEQWNFAQSGQKFYHNLPKVTYSVRDNPSAPWRASEAATKDEALKLVGGDTSRVMEVRTPSKDIAAQRLRQAGIPGIKYLDQGSRDKAFKVDIFAGKGDQPYATNSFGSMEQAQRYAAEKEAEGFKTKVADAGTRNYVVFDPKLIDIVKKYGVAGLGIFPAGQQVLIPVDHDPFVQ